MARFGTVGYVIVGNGRCDGMTYGYTGTARDVLYDDRRLSIFKTRKSAQRAIDRTLRIVRSRGNHVWEEDEYRIVRVAPVGTR